MNPKKVVAAFAVATVASLGLVVSNAPASAAPASTEHRVAVHKAHKPNHLNHHVNYMSSSYCGGPLYAPRFCINFNRTEQTYILGAGLTAAALLLCARFPQPAVCVPAGTIAWVAITYLTNRGGICGKVNPVLEVEYLPHPGGYAKCSDG